MNSAFIRRAGAPPANTDAHDEHNQKIERHVRREDFDSGKIHLRLSLVVAAAWPQDVLGSFGQLTGATRKITSWRTTRTPSAEPMEAKAESSAA